MVARVTHGNSTKQPSNTTFAEHQTAPAASKSDTPRVSGDQSGAREGQSTGGADAEERLNTCNRRLFTRA